MTFAMTQKCELDEKEKEEELEEEKKKRKTRRNVKRKVKGGTHHAETRKIKTTKNK